MVIIEDRCDLEKANRGGRQRAYRYGLKLKASLN